MMKKILKIANSFATFCILAVLVGAGGIAYVVHEFSKDLPDYKQLTNYEPPVSTRVYANDGSLLAEYSQERRVFVPIDAVPPMVIGAFLSAEDKNFYKHYGVDPEGVARAFRNNFLGGGNRQQGGSTITQQVAKNFLLSREKTYSRKIKEMLLALRMERIYSKNKILELYLNEIYLGFGNYGVAAASLNYFGKAVSELSPAQAAYLAALPKAPSNYNPFKRKSAALERRNWVIDRMIENGFISKSVGEKSKHDPLDISLQPPSPNAYVAGYFAEEIRREIAERYGDKALYSGGLFVRATLDPRLQVMARKALVDGLVRYDEARGWRGPVNKIALKGVDDWGKRLAEEPYFEDVRPWALGLILSMDGSRAVVGLRPEKLPSGELSPHRETGFITQEGVSWTRRGLKVLHVGDVVYVEPSTKTPKAYRLRQLPEISGAIVSLNPQTGRVLAMVGGFSFDQSEFNRATQALRQLGSAFKPFVYGAALDNGYTPSTTFLDGPITITVGREVWTPRNYDRKFRGFQTMRYALERSLNLVTIRVARDIGIPLVAEYAKRFGLYDDFPPYLPLALGAGETTLLRASGGYAMFVNGGRHIKPTLVDYVQDRWGRTIYRHDERSCDHCNQSDTADGSKPPVIVSNSEQVMDPLSAYQVVSILQGVVERGTAQIVKSVGRPTAGKTGTTNEAKDVWFIGFTPNMVTGVFMGYDKPRSLGPTAVGSRYAAPIFRDYMKMALEGQPILPFSIPEGIKLIRVNAKTGVASSGPGSILEAFKPGTLPPGRSPKGLGKLSDLEDDESEFAEAQDAMDDILPPPAPPAPDEDGAY
jgi:penicillin-binding protein 1A